MDETPETPGPGALFRRHAGGLRRFLKRRQGAGEAEDLVQDGFLRLLQNDGAGTLANPAAWLYRTCANLAADRHDYHCVRDAVHVETERLDELPDETADPAARFAQRQQLQRVWVALLGLPAPCRQAFLLNRLEGMSQRAIARHLGIGEKTVERHVLRALAACRQALDDAA